MDGRELEKRAREIAQGRKIPQWDDTFDHPIHGPLVFKGPQDGLPNALQHMALNVETDELLGNMAAEPSHRTVLLATSMAGIKTMLVKPQVGEITHDDDEDAGHKKITVVYYDPEEEQDTEFLYTVWTAFSVWRNEHLGLLPSVKKSSEAPTSNGTDSNESSSSD